MFGKKRTIRLALAAGLVMMASSSWAQKVSGTVKDANGDPVIGATIMEKGTQNGTVTDLDGNFTLDLKKGGSLDVSYVGMKPQTLSTSGKSSFNITLEDDATTLNDVVVVGYGTMKRKDLTGSVSSVTGEALAKNPVANIAEALQGQLAGVNIISQDGRPGATQSIRVRGGGSITQSNEPLYIVDGMPVSRIDDIPADNIESIDVLKDAASTAIYGARGANGVILVTTKQAKEGKAQVKYGMYYQIASKPDMLEVESPYDNIYRTWSYGKAYGEKYGDGVAKFFGLGSAYGNHLDEYKSQSAHNYMNDVLRSTGSWNHDLSVSGGTQRTKYYASVNFTNREGTLINSGFQRWNVNLKLQQELAKTLTLDVNARYGEMKFKGNRYEFATESYRYAPVDNVLGSGDPTDLGMGSQSYEASYNPVDIVNDYENLRNVYRLNLNSSLTWKAFAGFTAKTELMTARNWSKTQSWNGGNTQGQKYSTADLTNGDGYNVRWDTTLSYDVQGLSEDHSLNVMVGNEVLASKSNSYRIYGVGYPEKWTMEQAFGNINMYSQTGQGYVKSSIGEPSHTISWFGRVNYTLMDRYLFTATMRADGSSKFTGDNQWGYFPAAAFGWRITEEPFMASTKNWLDNLKLRLSIGSSGNDGIDASAFRSPWQTDSYERNGESLSIYKPSSIMGNPNLKWETTISRNLGIDYSFLNGKFNGAVDFYWNNTKDCLMLVPIDATTGFDKQFQNVAETSNKGIEFSFNYNIIKKKDFNLSFGLTYNYNVNNVEKLVEGALASAHTNWGSTMRIPNYDYIVQVGEPVGVIQGYKSMGYFTVDDFNYDTTTGKYTLKEDVKGVATAGNYPSALLQMNAEYDGKNTCPFPGAPKFEATDSEAGAQKATAKEQIIGRTAPKHTGGFRFNGNYKGFDFSLNFAYQLGGKVYNANVMYDMMGNKDTNLGFSRLAEASQTWKSYGIDASGDLYLVTDPTELAALNAGAKYAVPYSEYGIVNSEFVEDASFLRLQTLTLGYTFPKEWVKKLAISNARIYFTAGNLFCIKGYSGLDPDVNVSPKADSSYAGFPTTNYDFRSYPKSRTFTFGLNVAF